MHGLHGRSRVRDGGNEPRARYSFDSGDAFAHGVEGLDWNDLRDFLAISRHRTLSAAADALGVQQSTMGRRLKALEARVGAKLLQKTPADSY